MKKHLLLLFTALLPLVTNAHDFEVDGIWYNLTAETREAEVTNGRGCSGDITIPATINYEDVTYSVTSIGSYAFLMSWELTSINIPEGVTSIGDHAFEECINLAAITLPASVKSIGEYAFFQCSLTAITIPEGVTSIGVGAFRGCSSLTAINIPESVTSIGGWAFWGCTSLTTITIPEGVTSIGANAFSQCGCLTSIVVAEKNKFYDSRYGCNAIIDTNNNTLIRGCSATIIPYDVKSIGYAAFCGCSSLTAITLPEGVTSIGDCAFADCTSLTAITLPTSLTSIGDQAFDGCSSLTAITLPEGVTWIGDYAFYNCSSLTAITLPEGVTRIRYQTFYGCSSLTDVYCHAVTVPSTSTDAFHSSNIGQGTLHVPASALDSYRATAPWSEFGNIVALTNEETGVEQFTIDNAQMTIYDLHGRRVATPTKDGIYIVDGKKVMVKIGM